jgi:hypothetical protein
MPGGAALELEIAIPQYNTYAGNTAKVALPTGHFFWERLLQGPLDLARPGATSPHLASDEYRTAPVAAPPLGPLLWHGYMTPSNGGYRTVLAARRV